MASNRPQRGIGWAMRRGAEVRVIVVYGPRLILRADRDRWSGGTYMNMDEAMRHAQKQTDELVAKGWLLSAGPADFMEATGPNATQRAIAETVGKVLGIAP